MQMPEKKVIFAIILVVGALSSLYFTFGGSIFGGEPEYAPEGEEVGGEELGAESGMYDESAGGEDQTDGAYGADASPASGGSALNRRKAAASTPLAQGSVADRVEGILNRLIEKRRHLAPQDNGADRSGTGSGAGRQPNESGHSFQQRQIPVRTDALPEYAFTGVLVGERTSCALIGGYILKEGDLLPTGHQIVKIFRKSVHLRRPGASEDIIKFIEPRSGRSQADDSESDGGESDPLEEITEDLGGEGDEG